MARKAKNADPELDQVVGDEPGPDMGDEDPERGPDMGDEDPAPDVTAAPAVQAPEPETDVTRAAIAKMARRRQTRADRRAARAERVKAQRDAARARFNAEQAAAQAPSA